MSLNARMRLFLDEMHVPWALMQHPPTGPAAATARAAHVSVRSFAKVVVVKGREGGPLMAVIPADAHVDLQALADLSGHAHLALLGELELRALFPDCEVGAMPPFGQLYGMPVYVDEYLAVADEIAFNGGTHEDVVVMPWTEFKRLAHPILGEFCRS